MPANRQGRALSLGAHLRNTDPSIVARHRYHIDRCYEELTMARLILVGLRAVYHRQNTRGRGSEFLCSPPLTGLVRTVRPTCREA